MTDWSIEEDQYDYLDPDDPTSGASAEAGPARPDQPAAQGVPAELGDPVTDPTGSLFVWLDDDDRVVRVRVSNRWRARLKQAASSGAEPATLAGTLLAMLRHAQTGTGQPDAVPELDESVAGRSLSGDTIDALLERTLQLDDRRRELDARPAEDVVATSYETEPVEGLSDNRMVTVRLTEFGRAAAVDLDDAWLADARADDLGQSIEEAFAQAYAGWSPPRVVLGDFDRLAQERRLLLREVMATMQRGTR